jgi:GT2 family glycosyltransferase/spore maturation protein CgeB
MTGGPLVSAIILTRDGVDHLGTLLPALDRLAYRDLEVIVVDNGSQSATAEYLRTVRTRYPLRVITNTTNRSFSDANNQGIEVAAGELIWLLNDDIEPAGPDVLGHMVERLAADPAAAAVACRLVYPRRPGPRFGRSSAAPDLTLQHRGTAFRTESGIHVARNLGHGEDPLGPAAAEGREVQMATAACLLVRRSALAEVGGLSTGYDYGQEDVDLCLKLRSAGWRVVYEPQATFWHRESATQRLEDRRARTRRQLANRGLLADRWGPRIAREVLIDQLQGGLGWAGPLHVGITVTRDDPAAGWGDWYTAHELGDALQAIGWRVSYLERLDDRWYEPERSLDVVISLIDWLDVRRLPEGIARVAWVRNWTDRWLAQPWFDEYDIVLASSQRSKDLIDRRSVHVATLMPLATNPARFHTAGAEQAAPAADRVDVAFTANRWGQPRALEAIVPALVARGRSVAVYGKGWQRAPAIAAVVRGPLPYDQLPGAYASATVVMDDTAAPTLPYGAVNSRVFDALASGSLVITDNEAGARELFGELLPAASDADGLVALAEHWLADDDARLARVAALRAIVLERHTYTHRALELRDVLTAWATARRIDILVGPPSWAVARTWGDYHFGRAVQRALRRRGIRGRLRLRNAWERTETAAADGVLHLFGLAAPRVRPGQLSMVWIVSHPDLVTDEQLQAEDVVFVASALFAARLAARTGREVIPLHQATDPERFQPTAGGPRHELLFVGNSRRVRRPVVDAAARTGRDLAVYGRHWTPDLLDPAHLRGEHVPNEELAAYYSAATIVLNDHWADMAADGFLSNRLYDAAACGALVISDDVPGIEPEFDGGIVTFRDPAELDGLIAALLGDPERRAALAGRARAAVLERHTFGHRVATILDTIGPALAARPDRIVSATGSTSRPSSAVHTAAAAAGGGGAPRGARG